MIILDTNVVSETMRHLPSSAVIAWLDDQPRTDLYLCAPVVAEIGYGIARLKDSRRKRELLTVYRQVVDRAFEGRILPFDAVAAEAYAELVAKLESGGKTIDVIDAMIAAIAQSNGATLATRNTVHFKHVGLSLINPFGAA